MILFVDDAEGVQAPKKKKKKSKETTWCSSQVPEAGTSRVLCQSALEAMATSPAGPHCSGTALQSAPLAELPSHSTPCWVLLAPFSLFIFHLQCFRMFWLLHFTLGQTLDSWWVRRRFACRTLRSSDPCSPQRDSWPGKPMKTQPRGNNQRVAFHMLPGTKPERDFLPSEHGVSKSLTRTFLD